MRFYKCPLTRGHFLFPQRTFTRTEMNGRIIPIIALASALAQPLSAQQAEQLFTDESAAAFFGASPNLAAESRKYAKESLEEYNGKKFAKAYAKLVVSKYFSNLAKFGKNIEPEIRAKLLASPELLDDFVSVLSPEDWPHLSKCKYEAPVDAYVESILKQNLSSERCAIHRYEKLAQLTDGKDFTTFSLATQILADEVEHETDLESWLDDIRVFRESLVAMSV